MECVLTKNNGKFIFFLFLFDLNPSLLLSNHLVVRPIFSFSCIGLQSTSIKTSDLLKNSCWQGLSLPVKSRFSSGLFVSYWGNVSWCKAINFYVFCSVSTARGREASHQEDEDSPTRERTKSCLLQNLDHCVFIGLIIWAILPCSTNV